MIDPFAERLRRLKPSPGPPPEAVAFAAGSLAATRRLRRRLAPLLVLLVAGNVGGWGVAARLASRAAPAVPVPAVAPVSVPEAGESFARDDWQVRVERFEPYDAAPAFEPDATPVLPPFSIGDLS